MTQLKEDRLQCLKKELATLKRIYLKDGMGCSKLTAIYNEKCQPIIKQIWRLENEETSTNISIDDISCDCK